jgi:hypothetical protein
MVDVFRGIEDAKHHQRRLPMFFRKAPKLVLEDMAGFVGHVASKPLALGPCLLHPLEALENLGAAVRNDDLRRIGKDHHLAGGVVPEESVGRSCGHSGSDCPLPSGIHISIRYQAPQARR